MFCWRTPLRSSPSVQDLPWRALASRDCDSSLPSVWRNTSTPWTGTNSPDLYINSLFCSSLLCFAVFVFAATTFYIPLEVRCAVEGPAPDQIRPIFTAIGYASARSLLLWILRERKKMPWIASHEGKVKNWQEMHLQHQKEKKQQQQLTVCSISGWIYLNAGITACNPVKCWRSLQRGAQIGIKLGISLGVVAAAKWIECNREKCKKRAMLRNKFELIWLHLKFNKFRTPRGRPCSLRWPAKWPSIFSYY